MQVAPIEDTPASSVRRRISETSAIAWNVATGAHDVSKVRACAGARRARHLRAHDMDKNVHVDDQRRLWIPCLRISSKNARRGFPAVRAARVMLPFDCSSASSMYLRSNSETIVDLRRWNEPFT